MKTKKKKSQNKLKASMKDLPEKRMPHNIKPMLATLVKKSFDDEDWIYEIKWDGYRAIAEVTKDKVNLYSRNNNSFNQKFFPVVDSLNKIDENLILDGEIVSVDEKGKSSFQLLQNYQRAGEGNLVYMVFDLLYYDKYDLKLLTLLQRKEILKNVLNNNPHVKYSDHILKEGKAFFNEVKKNNLEGIIAKNGNSKYQTNSRSREWLKIKTSQRQEAVIGGFSEPQKSRKYIGAVVLGVYEKNDLIYIGHAGNGFTDDDLKEMYEKLKKIKRKTSPFKETPKTNTPAKWVTPKLVCEVSFSEWTDEGLMRHPVFVGLRDD
ncbi:MAG: non-homologous end-joining DNA ligase, partial [Ignavibacteriaceae bacterium]